MPAAIFKVLRRPLPDGTARPHSTASAPHAVALGKMGGSKGGKRRAANLTPEERSASSRKAALAKWAKAREKAQQKDLQDKT